MDTTIAEIRELERRDMELDAEKEWIRKRRREILELNQGARKPRRDTLTGRTEATERGQRNSLQTVSWIR